MDDEGYDDRNTHEPEDYDAVKHGDLYEPPAFHLTVPTSPFAHQSR